MVNVGAVPFDFKENVMKHMYGFKIQHDIASLVGAIFVCLMCLSGMQMAYANTQSISELSDIQLQSKSQDVSAWQMPADVVLVPNEGRVQAEGEVEVLAFFWYGCPHCAIFEPSFVRWRATQSQEVKILTLPVSWNKTMVTHQRMYYTLEVLSRLDLHDQVFTDVASAKDALATPASALSWAKKQGISPSQWRAAFNSPAVTQKMQFAQAQFERFGLTGVPALIVDGRYQIILTDNTIQTLDALVKQGLSKAK